MSDPVIRSSPYAGVVGQTTTHQKQQDVWRTRSSEVMGLKILTVVGASVLSLLVSGNIMAVIYGVAEKAHSELVLLLRKKRVLSHSSQLEQ